VHVIISLKLHVLTFAFSTIEHSNFEVLLAETSLIFRTFPFVKFSTNKCYDWSSEISNKTSAASVAIINSANETSVGSK